MVCFTIQVILGSFPRRYVRSSEFGSNCCQIRYKTGYYETAQSQANQSDRFSFSSLQAGSIPVTSINFLFCAETVTRNYVG